MSESFWSTRPILQHIHTFAQARRTGPWSVLGVCLARAVATVPPEVVLPPIVGGTMSLNMFFALVGASGSGKGASESVARDAIAFCDRRGIPATIESFPLGSGEGIARTFRSADLDPDDPNDRTAAMFTAPEVDTLAALFGRQGATLEGELRKLYSGETIGFNNARKETRSVVAAHSYRASLVIGVQPLRSELLLRGADGGTPQRITWLPVTDPDAADKAPATPDPMTVLVPSWQPGPLSIPNEAVTAVDTHRLAMLRGGTDVDPLDGHALLCRLKTACGLMVLDGRSIVSVEDWELAGTVMAVSNWTRAACERAMRDRTRLANKARALAAADRDELVSERKMQRAKDGILRWLERDGELSRNDLRKKLKVDIRDHLDAAIADLVDAGTIASESATQKYTCTKSTPPENGPSPAVIEGVPKVHRVPLHSVPPGETSKSDDPGMTPRVQEILAKYNPNGASA